MLQKILFYFAFKNTPNLRNQIKEKYQIFRSKTFKTILYKKIRASCIQLALMWWERMDSNHRSRRQQIYSLPPLAARELSQTMRDKPESLSLFYGAGDGTRTRDLLITNQLLYQLSYTSIIFKNII